MSKGKKWRDPKRRWKYIDKQKYKSKDNYEWILTHFEGTHPYRLFSKAHVMSNDHKKFKWYFRHKKWFKELDGHIGMSKMNKRELWFWD